MLIATPPVNTGFLADLDEYVRLFRGEFRRSDQARWLGVYLQGLLLAGGRKNMETLAGMVRLPPGLAVDDVAQALQNFVNQSPWDAQRLGRRYRAVLAGIAADAPGLFRVEDVTYPKQGQHSVGVQRQYSSTLGRKVNCQVAVSLHHVDAAGHRPLALRLYLPRKWLEEPRRLEAAGVPLEFRVARSRGEIALDLLDQVRGEGWSGAEVSAGSAYLNSASFREGVAARGLRLRDGGDEPAAFAEGMARLRELGLEHFEGRSWRGFHHHACLVLLAYGFMLLRGRAGPFKL
jgi:SRSO17 transposase